MEAKLSKTGCIVAGILSFIFCLAGGIWILKHAGFSDSDALSTGIGLYFIGKALFVGPMLVISALHKTAS